MKLNNLIKFALKKIVILIFFVAGTAIAELREMQYEEIPTRVIPDASYDSKSLFIVETTLSHLSFESTKGILPGSVLEKEPGIWWVTLKPGVQLISFSSDGFLPLKDVRHNFEKRKAWAIKLTAKTQSVVGIGDLAIVTDPSGCTVFFNGAKLAKTTPLSLTGQPAGTHKLRIERGADYIPIDTLIVVSPNTKTETNIKLNLSFGSMKIKSSIKGSVVYLDNINMGYTPYVNERVDIGTYEVRIKREHYHDVVESVKIRSGLSTYYKGELKPKFGKVKFQSNPRGAKVYANGEYWGITPVEKDTLYAGEYEIRMEKQLYFPHKTNIIIVEGKFSKINEDLSNNYGTISIITDPPGMGIKINNKILKNKVTPIELKYLPGNYNIKIYDELYHSVDTLVVVDINGFYPIDIELERKTGGLSISSNPSNAKIAINNKYYGKTPLSLENLPTGDYNIVISKDGYYPVNKLVKVSENKYTRVKVNLTTGGALSVTSNPSNAFIFLNYMPIGRTPLVKEKIKPGYYTLKYRRWHYIKGQKNISILPGKLNKYNLDIERDDRFYLLISVFMAQSDASIYSDDSYMATQDSVLTLSKKGKTIPANWWGIKISNRVFKNLFIDAGYKRVIINVKRVNQELTLRETGTSNQFIIGASLRGHYPGKGTGFLSAGYVSANNDIRWKYVNNDNQIVSYDLGSNKSTGYYFEVGAGFDFGFEDDYVKASSQDAMGMNFTLGIAFHQSKNKFGENTNNHLKIIDGFGTVGMFYGF